MTYLLRSVTIQSLVASTLLTLGLSTVFAADVKSSPGAARNSQSNGFPETAPVYKVTRHGIDEEQAGRLARSFNIPDLTPDENGAVNFTDTKAFLALPMRQLAPENGLKSEDDGGLVFEGFDFDAIRKMEVLALESATAKVLAILKESDLLPRGAEPLATHTRFEAVSNKGAVLADSAIDTAVSFRFRLDEFPLEGPGANIRATIGANGDVTQLSYSVRALAEAGRVKIVNEEEARKRCATWTTLSDKPVARTITPALVYYAPPLSERVETLEPGIRCEAVDVKGVASQVYFVPAALDAQPLPLDLHQPRRKVTRGFLDFMFDFDFIRSAHAAFNRRDVGSEGTGPCSGLPNTGTNIASFNNRMITDGVAVQFSWLDAAAWEQDWKDPSVSGDDQDWVDDVDMAYWQGHGWPGGFSFSGCSSNDDASLTNADALWGNRNVEWISLFTCLILAEESGGERWWQRWGPAFDRLHQINSFDTVSYHSSQHGGIFANYMLQNNPMTVRQAWAQASIDDQPAQVVWATMGVISNGSLTNFNDYYWGKGSVGPDIPASQIGGYWRISGGS